MATTAASVTKQPALHIDKPGLLVAGLALVALVFLPFATFRANRIVPGDAVALWNAVPHSLAIVATLVIAVVAALSLVRSHPLPRLAIGAGILAFLFVLIGLSGTHLTPEGDRLARVSPASGFWLLVFAFGLLVTDALSRLAAGPLIRLLLLAGFYLLLGGGLTIGLWDDLSLMKEYANRAASFWNEGRSHLLLAVGSVAAAILTGVPIGIFCHRAPSLRGAVLNVLNTIQTIPSMAMFALLIAPLGWVAANVPGASALGIRGIGAAPAFLALYLYSLLPVVANTVAGLAGVAPDVREAARGTGMTSLQRLMKIEFPLALPTILTGVRIVLVQNIGLVTIAALIGGGGFGVFVFQGLGQMAADLVLLGALPTVLLAFSAAVILDVLIELASPPPSGGSAR